MMENDRGPRATAQHDALLVVSFGGPEKPEDVMPFLENVLRGRNVPRKRMLEVARHYEHLGGRSPINDQNRALVRALEIELAAKGPALGVYWGNRNWHPLLADTLRAMKADGVRRALAFVTSAYSSYSGCRQYRENIEQARRDAGDGAPLVDKLRVCYNHPRFIAAWVERIRAALEAFPKSRRSTVPIVFTAHSIPLAMARNCRYVEQLEETCRLIAECLGRGRQPLVFQSRSGPPSQPWLKPDIQDYLRELAAAGAGDVMIVPVGFVSDHMEVVYDLDVDARRLCEALRLNMVRAATPGKHPEFVSMIRDLVLERIERAVGRPDHDACPDDCCLPG